MLWGFVIACAAAAAAQFFARVILPRFAFVWDQAAGRLEESWPFRNFIESRFYGWWTDVSVGYWIKYRVSIWWWMVPLSMAGVLVLLLII